MERILPWKKLFIWVSDRPHAFQTDELNERISLGKVDILRHLTLISAILRNRRPLYNEVVEKLSVGSAIDRT